VGLVDQCIEVVHVVPADEAGGPEKMAMSVDQFEYEPAPWRWLRDWRLRRMGPDVGSLNLDVLHVLDASLQSVGARLGSALEVPVVCSVWTRAGANGLRPVTGSLPITYTVPTAALGDRVGQRLGAETDTQRVRPGVYRRPGHGLLAPLANPGHRLSCVVVGDGRADAAYQVLLEALAQVRGRLGHGMYFLFSVEGEQHALWRMAEKLGLLDQISLVGQGPGGRELLLQADVLLQPQALGAVRTVLLQAMAAGRPVVAALDPMVDCLRHNQTAYLMDAPTVEQWADCLLGLVAEPGPFLELGRSAADYVHRHHTVSGFVTSIADLYRRLAPESIPFSAAGGRS